jgi:hypothetical protein
MQHEPILQMDTVRMVPRYAHHKPFTIKFPEKCEWQKEFKLDINASVVWLHRLVQDQHRHWVWDI